MKRPKLFGAPQPADGILSAGDEISIRFDEPIEAGLLTPFNFSLQGVLNSYELNHNTSVNLDGTNDFVKIEDGLNLNSSYTTEFWLKRDALATNQVVFSKGYTATDRLEIGFDAGNKLFVNVSGQNITTSVTFTESDWHHYAVIYDAAAKQLSAYKDDKYILEKVAVTGTFSGTGPINIGKSVISGDGFLNGNIHELRVWSKPLNLSTVYADMYLAKTGAEVGLVGYWPMSEAFGNKVFDKARFRHGLMFADWEVLPKGKAMKFDGADDRLELNTASTVVVTPEMDYTIEFWFKALASAGQSVIFSSGKGDGSDTFNGPAFSLSVGMTTQGAMFVQSNGQLLSSPGETNYRDSNWHHFALSLSRNSNINMFVDGVQIASAPSALFGGLAGATMWVGARGYKISAVDVAFDQHFNGLVDDVRIWKMSKKLAQLDLNRTSKLTGDETGLVAYYPFEYYALNTGVRLLAPTLADQWTNPFGANGGTAVASGGAAFDDDAPNLKDARPVTKVDFDWAVNNDEIIITPSQAMAAVIEKTILEIAVSDVEDKNENRLASPVAWTAFVDRNQLKWGEEQVSLEKKLYQASAFEVEIVNFGGTEQSFSVVNLPPWLKAEPAQGVLPPLSAKKVKFTVNEGISTGYYAHDLYLSGDFGFDEKLQLDVRVYEDEPQWSVNPADFQYSMNVIAQLKVNGIISRDSHDKVAAFVNGECRGAGNLQYVEQFDQYQLYLDIYSNSATGESIELRVWDASKGVEHRQVKPNYTFMSNVLFGSPAAPEMIEADETYLFPLTLNPGWNWVSFNLLSDKLGNLNTFFDGVTATAGDQVKSQLAADVFAGGVGWTGSLSTSGGFKPGEMYMMKIQKGGLVEVVGKPAPASTSIPLKAGWNWIGVIPQFALSVDEALASYNASNGDIIKGKTAFATYRQGLGWIGSLTNLKPGEGYALKAAAAGNLVYPAVSFLQNSRFHWEPEVEKWKTDAAAFADNMNIIATLSGIDKTNVVVGAFVDGICRGYTSPIRIDSERSLLFLTIQGSGPEKVSFRLLDMDSDEEWLLNERLGFQPNLALGSFDAPAEFTLADGLASDFGSEMGVYPNPFTGKLKVKLPYAESGYELRITDLSGRFVSAARISDVTGRMVFEWDVPDMLPGLYVLSVNSGDHVFNFKVVKE